MIGRPFWDTPWWTHSPREQQRLKEAVTEARSGRLVAFDTTHVGRDGAQHYVEFTLRPVSDDSGDIICLIAEGHDVTERKKTEERLRESEEQYRSFVSRITEGIYRLDMVPPVPVNQSDPELIAAINRSTVVTEVNNALARMYGLTIEEMVGRPATDFAPDYGVRALLAVKSPDGSVAQLETHDIDKDGQDLVLSESFPAEIAAGNLLRIWGVQTNITERKKVEETLRLTEFSIEHSGLAMFWFAAEGRIVRVNETACRELGYRRDELLGLTIHDLDPNFPLKADWDLAWERIETGQDPVILQTNHRRKNGTVFPVEIVSSKLEFGEKAFIFSCAWNISSRKTAEEALRKSEENFRALSANSCDSIMRFDKKFRLIYINPMVEQHFGLSPETLIGRTPRELGFPDNLATLYENTLAGVIANGTVQRIEFQLPQGTWIDLQCIPEFDQGGMVQGVATSARDITQRKLAEEEKGQLQTQLLQAQKMESVGRLAGEWPTISTTC